MPSPSESEGASRRSARLCRSPSTSRSHSQVRFQAEWLWDAIFAGSYVRGSVLRSVDVPDSTNVYWQQLFSVPSAGLVFPYPADWFGVYEISLDLDAGTYWVAFGLPTDDFGTGGMPPTTLQELDNYAFGNPTGGWTGDDTINIGVRIAVPEPNMLAQLGAGMFGLVVLHGRRRGRRQSQVPRVGGGNDRGRQRGGGARYAKHRR